MADLLASWVGMNARRTLLARYPQVGLAADATAAMLEAQDAGVLDRADLGRAAAIATGLRKGLGWLQESDTTLDIETRCALNLVKRGVRDASLVLPWPQNPDGDGTMTIRLSQAADEALVRLSGYDPLLGVATYLGNMLADMQALALGIRVELAR